MTEKRKILIKNTIGEVNQCTMIVKNTLFISENKKNNYLTFS